MFTAGSSLAMGVPSELFFDVTLSVPETCGFKLSSFRADFIPAVPDPAIFARSWTGVSELTVWVIDATDDAVTKTSPTGAAGVVTDETALEGMGEARSLPAVSFAAVD